MFTQIYDYLTDKGYDVYSIGQYEGKCKEPYIVIREAGTTETLNNNIVNENVELIIFYPVGSYSKLGLFLVQLKKDMKNLSYLKRTFDGSSSAIVVDDTRRAYTTFLSYRKIKTKGSE